ncbi:tetratricopeptide repeat protein, partial [Patescibacteria group bacterium]
WIIFIKYADLYDRYESLVKKIKENKLKSLQSKLDIQIKKSKSSFWYLVLSVIFFFFALTSKENVVLAPLLFGVVYFILKPSKVFEVISKIWPFSIAYLLYFPLRINALGEFAFTKDQSHYILNPLNGVDLMTCISTAFKIAYIYISKTFIPYNLTASYDYNHVSLVKYPWASWQSIVGILLISLLILLALKKKGNSHVVKVGAVSFLISYLIISKLFITKGILMGERLMFFPSLGIVIIVGWVLSKLYKANKLLGIISISSIIIIYSAVLIPRNTVWMTPQGFFEQMVKDSPRSVQAHSALARGYFTDGRLNDAKREAEIGYSIYPKHSPLLNVLGKIAYIQENYDKSVNYFKSAIDNQPGDFGNYENNYFYALNLAKLDRCDQALEHISDRLKMHPEDSEIKMVVAACLYKGRKTEEALSEENNWVPGISREERLKVLEEF